MYIRRKARHCVEEGGVHELFGDRVRHRCGTDLLTTSGIRILLPAYYNDRVFMVFIRRSLGGGVTKEVLGVIFTGVHIAEAGGCEDKSISWAGLRILRDLFSH